MSAVNGLTFHRPGVSGGESVKSSGTVSAMTPTPPTATAPANPSIGPAGVPPVGGVGPAFVLDASWTLPLGPAWFLAICHRCGGEEFAEPFRSDVRRDDWAAKHVESTGHVVMLTVEEGDPHTAAVMLGATEDRDRFRFLCTGEGLRCQRWNGPYDTPQLAAAAGRDHVCVVA